MSRVAVASVWLRLGEGPIRLVDANRSRFFPSYAAANRELAAWARSLPESSGYFKVDFVVTFADGEQYEGRYDLANRHRFGASLERQMVDVLRFRAGLYCPPNVPRSRYDALVASYGAERREAAIECLRTYDFGGDS